MADASVPVARTLISHSEMYGALRAAWRAKLGTEPSRASLLTLMSQWAFETADGRASNNWNVAGIKWTPGCGFDFAEYLTREMFHGAWQTLRQRFRAYASLDEGVADYLRTLRATFGYAWPAVDAGDPAQFAQRLRARGYYTAPVEQYTAGLVSWYKRLDADLPPDTEPDLRVVEDVRNERSVTGPVVDEPAPEPPEAA